MLGWWRLIGDWHKIKTLKLNIPGNLYPKSFGTYRVDHVYVWNIIYRDLLWFLSLTQPFQDLIGNSPYYLPYSSDDASSENLALDQLIIP